MEQGLLLMVEQGLKAMSERNDGVHFARGGCGVFTLRSLMVRKFPLPARKWFSFK
jgi:hypothetical protein